MKNKFYWIAMLLIVIVAGVIPGNYVSAAGKEKQAYKKYVKKNIPQKYQISDYTLVDVDKDGTKEMIYNYSYGVMIFTYKDGKVIKLKNEKGNTANGGVAYNKNKKQICIPLLDDAVFGSGTYKCYEISSGNIKIVSTYKMELIDKYGDWSYIDFRYYKDGKEMSSHDEFDKILNGKGGWKYVY